MSLTVTVKEQRVGVFVISPVGSIDSDTYSILEDRADLILESSPSEIVFDMKSVDYMSSAGIRVILKVGKAQKKNGGKIILVHLQPQVKKVFDIIKALPTMTVFTSIEELDDYLDKMQRKVKEE
jgi:anti-anti-sigma factor